MSSAIEFEMFSRVNSESLTFLPSWLRRRHSGAQGVRESPEGGSHYTEGDEIQYIKQKSLRSKISYTQQPYKEHISSSSQTDDFSTDTEESTQTDLNMLSMNKLLENYEFFTPNNTQTTVPERLRKHNSVDIHDVDIETYVQPRNNDRYKDVIDDKQIINPVNENVLNTVNDDNLQTEGITFSIPIIKGPASSHSSSECSSRRESTYNVSPDESLDENNNNSYDINNRKESTTKTDDSFCTQDTRDSIEEQHTTNQEKCLNKSNTKTNEPMVNLAVANIIEYDRSDVSSDSENDSKRVKENRRLSLTQRKRNRSLQQKHRRSKSENESLQEEEDAENKSEEMNGSTASNTINVSPMQRRRRVGVSAEPVRVSWSTLRESYKQQQLNSLASVNSNEQIDDQIKEGTDCDSIGTPDIGVSEVTEEQLNSLIQNIPSIEVVPHDSENEHDETSEAMPSNEQSREGSLNTSSLQVPQVGEPCSTNNSINISNLSTQSYIDDKELEKKFNNIVFAFKTDQYTLQRRLENQERARDVSESGMDKEIAKLSTTIQDMQKYDKGSSEYSQVFLILCKQADILRKAAMKISAQSEQHGCYQQEYQTSPCIESVLKYADTLRFNMIKMKGELDEYKKRQEYYEHSDISTTNEDKTSTSETEFPKTETVQVSDTKEATDETIPSTRRTFSSVSKTLVMANGMSKLRQRLNKQEESLEIPTVDESLTKKRVSFGETSVSEDNMEETSVDTEFCSSSTSSPLLQQIPQRIKTLGYKFLLGLIFIAIVYFIIYMIANSLEVDTLRLYDKILKFIPHTIEPADNKMDKR